MIPICQPVYPANTKCIQKKLKSVQKWFYENLTQIYTYILHTTVIYQHIVDTFSTTLLSEINYQCLILSVVCYKSTSNNCRIVIHSSKNLKFYSAHLQGHRWTHSQDRWPLPIHSDQMESWSGQNQEIQDKIAASSHINYGYIQKRRLQENNCLIYFGIVNYINVQLLKP